MKPIQIHAPRAHATRRAVVGVAGVAVGSITMAAVVALFGDASSLQWLSPSPTNLAAAQRCDQAAARERQPCMHAAVAQAKARDSETRLADAKASPPGG